MKRLLFLWLCLAAGSVPGAAAPSALDSCIGTATSTSVSCTVNSDTGSNLTIVAGVLTNQNATISGVTHNGDALSVLTAATDGHVAATNRMGTFKRAGIDVGSLLTVTATISGSQPVILIAVVVQDNDQTTPTDGDALYDPETSGTTATVDVTSQVGDLVLEFTGIGQSSSADEATLTQGADQTTLENGTVTDNFRMWASTQAGAATATMSSSWTGSMGRLLMAYNLNAVAGSPAVYSRRIAKASQ